MNTDYNAQIAGVRTTFVPRIQLTSQSYPASARQLNYLCDLAEREGMDAEALASIRCNKDVANLTEGEADALIAAINGG